MVPCSVSRRRTSGHRIDQGLPTQGFCKGILTSWGWKLTNAKVHSFLGCFVVFGLRGIPWLKKVAIERCASTASLARFKFFVACERMRHFPTIQGSVVESPTTLASWVLLRPGGSVPSTYPYGHVSPSVLLLESGIGARIAW
jgi:hypothetical protein